MRIAAIAWCMLIPGLQVYLFRLTRPELLKNHMEGPSSFPVLLAELINSKRIKINYSDLTIEFWNGSKIFLCHCQYVKDLAKYQGAEIHVLLMDELTHFLEEKYRFLRGRLRLGALQLPEKYQGLFPRILCGSNPGSIGHNWVKLSFVDNAAPMQVREMEKTEGGMKRQFIPALLEDNPTLTENDPDYEFRLEGLGSPELVRAMRMGDWDIVAGGMLDDLWKRERHVIAAFPIPSSWYVDRSFDWGSSAPFGVAWWAESDGTEATMADGTKRSFPRGTVFLINEWYGWTGRANTGLKLLAVEIASGRDQEDGSRLLGILEREEWMRESGLIGKDASVSPGPADSSIFDAENGVCMADDMRKAGVRWLKADKSPGSRKTGWERLRKYLKASLSFPMEEPGIFIFNTCAQWIRTVPVLPRDTSKPDDVDSQAEDHMGDLTRYRIMNPPKKVWTVA
jgi:hypothetical protein